jgi:hypothetical protein
LRRGERAAVAVALEQLLIRGPLDDRLRRKRECRIEQRRLDEAPLSGAVPDVERSEQPDHCVQSLSGYQPQSKSSLVFDGNLRQPREGKTPL